MILIQQLWQEWLVPRSTFFSSTGNEAAFLMIRQSCINFSINFDHRTKQKVFVSLESVVGGIKRFRVLLLERPLRLLQVPRHLWLIKNCVCTKDPSGGNSCSLPFSLIKKFHRRGCHSGCMLLVSFAKKKKLKEVAGVGKILGPSCNCSEREGGRILWTLSPVNNVPSRFFHIFVCLLIPLKCYCHQLNCQYWSRIRV